MAGRTRAERNGARTTLWLENPGKRNALDMKLLAELTREVQAAAADATVRLVVLRGFEGAFGSGADFDAFAAADGQAFAARFRRLDEALAEAAAALAAVPQPLLAVLEGPCMGGAVQLALCADLRLAAPDLKLAIPAAGIGIIYPLDALARLQALIGPSRTKLLILTGRRIGAAEAEAFGLVDRVSPPGDIEREIDAIEAEIARAPAETIALYKKTLDGLASGSDPGLLAAEQAEHNASPETFARIDAILAARGRR